MLMFLLYPVSTIDFVDGNVATCLAVATKEKRADEREVDGAGPVGEEDEGSDGEHVI